MNLLEELNTLLLPLLPIETGLFSDVPPDLYLVITPLTELFEVHGDNEPGYEIQEARLSLFTKGNYIKIKNEIVRTLLGANFTITDRRYISHEDDTSYHHYAIDVAKTYEFKLETEE